MSPSRSTANRAMAAPAFRRAAGSAVVIGVLAMLVGSVACGPTDRRAEATPSVTPTATPTPTPSPSPSVAPTVVFRQVFLRVEGTAGTPFVGQIIDGSGSRTVDGVVPQDFVLATPREFVSATFSKTAEGLSTIQAQIFVDGVRVAEQSTTTNFGSVTVNVPLS